MRSQTTLWHKYQLSALDLLSLAGTCTLRNLVLSCPVDHVKYRSYATLEEALLALPASTLCTTSATIVYDKTLTTGSCPAIRIKIEGIGLSGKMAVWAMPGTL